MFRGLSRGRNRRHGGSRQSMGLLLLAVQILQFGVDRIPIVTLVTLLINIGNSYKYFLSHNSHINIRKVSKVDQTFWLFLKD